VVNINGREYVAIEEVPSYKNTVKHVKSRHLDSLSVKKQPRTEVVNYINGRQIEASPDILSKKKISKKSRTDNKKSFLSMQPEKGQLADIKESLEVFPKIKPQKLPKLKNQGIINNKKDEI